MRKENMFVHVILKTNGGLLGVFRFQPNDLSSLAVSLFLNLEFRVQLLKIPYAKRCWPVTMLYTLPLVLVKDDA